MEQKRQGECNPSSKKTKRTVESPEEFKPNSKLSLLGCNVWHLSGMQRTVWNTKLEGTDTASAISAETLSEIQGICMGFSFVHLPIPQEKVRKNGGILPTADWHRQGH